MLKKIKLDNYTTFMQPTEIDFSATNYKFLENENVGNSRILKGCLFVGENASGKTKILESIKLLLDLLFGNSDIDYMVNSCFYTKKDNYKLEYTFIEEDKEIIYSIELSLKEIISEKLIFDNEIILERLGNTGKFTLNEEKIVNEISNKLLFLRRIYFDTNFYENKTLIKWFEYLKKSVFINCYFRDIVTYTGNDLLIHEYLDNNTVDEINQFLNKINYKQKIEYGTETPNKEDEFYVKSSDNNKFISFNKQGTNIYIPEILNLLEI